MVNCRKCIHHKAEGYRVKCDVVGFYISTPQVTEGKCDDFEEIQKGENIMSDCERCISAVGTPNGYRCVKHLITESPGDCPGFSPLIKPERHFHVWDKDRAYQGKRTTDGNPLEFYPYWEEILPPPCPDKPNAPEYPDGWYWLELKGNRYTKVLRRKIGNDLYNENHVLAGHWTDYKVVASIEGVKFVDGRDQVE